MACLNRVSQRSQERSAPAPSRKQPAKSRTPENELIFLQRTFGNKAVASVLDGRVNMRQTGESLGAVLQRKKTNVTGSEEKVALKKAWNFMPKKTKLSDTMGEDEKNNAMLADLDNVYNTYRDKGGKYLADLAARRKAHQESPENYTADMKIKRDEYNANFAKNYVTATRSGTGSDAGSTHVSSSGFVGDERPAKPAPNVYENVFNFGNNTIRALDNYANKDKARLHDAEMNKSGGNAHRNIGLPNSEILWQQGMQAATSQLWFPSLGGNQRAKASMKSVTTVRRENIQNADTRAVVFMAYPNGQAYWSAAMTWGKDTEEFKAVMGTPNAATAIHMLGDHLDEMTATDIGDVTATADEHLVIRYV